MLLQTGIVRSMAGLMPVLWEKSGHLQYRTSCLAMPVRIETA